ncbi:unnamed protein product, partial [Rotaria sordida]
TTTTTTVDPCTTCIINPGGIVAPNTPSCSAFCSVLGGTRPGCRTATGSANCATVGGTGTGDPCSNAASLFCCCVA